MPEWDATTYEAKDNLLHVVRHEADRFFALAEDAGTWEAPTACPEWQVRDLVGHIIDVTESYFVGFDVARSGAEYPEAFGTRAMQHMLDEGAKAHRQLSQADAVERLQGDFAKLMEMCAALGPDEWTGLVVPHKYMGPLPAFFYPVFQLMDYGVHSWDIRQGTGRAHGLDGDAADLLVPFMLILWSATTDIPAGTEPCVIGVEVCSGHNAGSWRLSAGPDGLTYEPGATDDLPATLVFDPGSFVLTAFGRSNSGTICGDTATAERYLNMFFRI
jgi:uncharacterized protein (TIGR03083 family)